MQTIAVREHGLVANFHCPSTSGTHPGVIVMGGAGGGLGSTSAVGSLLAEHGYAALALAYFGLEHLPVRLEEIPLEYFKSAIEWMRSQPSVEPNKIGIVGTSKGGEAALLVSATYQEIGAVVAYSPSHVVFQGIDEAWSTRQPSGSDMKRQYLALLALFVAFITLSMSIATQTTCSTPKAGSQAPAMKPPGQRRDYRRWPVTAVPCDYGVLLATASSTYCVLGKRSAR